MWAHHFDTAPRRPGLLFCFQGVTTSVVSSEVWRCWVCTHGDPVTGPAPVNRHQQMKIGNRGRNYARPKITDITCRCVYRIRNKHSLHLFLVPPLSTLLANSGSSCFRSEFVDRGLGFPRRQSLANARQWAWCAIGCRMDDLLTDVAVETGRPRE